MSVSDDLRNAMTELFNKCKKGTSKPDMMWGHTDVIKASKFSTEGHAEEHIREFLPKWKVGKYYSSDHIVDGEIYEVRIEKLTKSETK